jgi:hypothetical protein
MKPAHLLLLTVCALGFGSAWLIRLRTDGSKLATEFEQERIRSRQIAATQRAKIEAETKEQADLVQQISQVRSQLANEQKVAAETTRRKTEMQAKLPPVDENEIVVSFGRIRDMALELGELASLGKHMLNGKNRQMTAEENEKFMNSTMKIITWQPEIAGFEDSPEEISSLQAGTIAKAFDLDPATTARVEQTIADHFTQMKRMGVTASSQNRPGWRDQRSAMITQLMLKLRPLLPANSDAAQCLPFVLNIGAGFQQNVDVNVDAKGESTGTVSMSLPNWPPVPWLQKN